MWLKNSTLAMSLMRPLILGLLLILSGCGGGSAGTGTGTRTIEGTVSDQSGAGLEGVEVALVESGESTTTDSNGEFVLSTEAGPTEVVLEIRANEVSSTIALENLDANSLRCRLRSKLILIRNR